MKIFGENLLPRDGLKLVKGARKIHATLIEEKLSAELGLICFLNFVNIVTPLISFSGPQDKIPISNILFFVSRNHSSAFDYSPK